MKILTIKTDDRVIVYVANNIISICKYRSDNTLVIWNIGDAKPLHVNMPSEAVVDKCIESIIEFLISNDKELTITA